MRELLRTKRLADGKGAVKTESTLDEPRFLALYQEKRGERESH
jgi:hypothetical protein